MDKKIKVFAIIVSTCTVVCLSLVIQLTMTIPESQTTVRKDEICIRNEFGPLICGKTSEILHNHLKIIIENQYVEAKRKDKEKQQKYIDKNRVDLMAKFDKVIWEMKPAAKLTGKKHPSSRKADYGTEMVPIRDWHHRRQELSDTDGFKRNGISYHKGRLVVPVDGTYFIYSNLDFFEDCNPPDGIPNVRDMDTPIKHSIFKFNIHHRKEIEIVSNVQPHMVSANGFYNSYSSYVSSLVDLKAGDELTVKVSNITYLRYTHDNYFGVNLI